jgi:hypothetical protein
MNFCREPAKPRRRSAAFSGYASSPSGQGGFAGEIWHARRRRAARVNGVPIHSNGLLGRNSVCLELLCFRFHGLCVGFFIFGEALNSLKSKFPGQRQNQRIRTAEGRIYCPNNIITLCSCNRQLQKDRMLYIKPYSRPLDFLIEK